MSEKTDGRMYDGASVQRTADKLSLAADFALRANPHVKFSIGDINQAWAELPRQQASQAEDELVASGLFIVFDKKGKRRFMLKDSVRAGLIAAGSCDEYLMSIKARGEMSGQELALAGLKDEEDNIRKADEEERARKKRSHRIIMAAGIAILLTALVIAKILLGRIAKP